MNKNNENKETFEKFKGYCTITYRLLLYQTNLEDFQKTKELYNQTLLHYFQILVQHPDWLEISNMQLMRKLELQSIGSKSQKKAKEEVLYPLNHISVKIPLYFRRAAINAAISMAKSEQHQKRSLKLPLSSEAAPVYYKGMYRNFLKHSIELKLYHENTWHWNTYSFQGRSLPAQSKTLSPSLKIKGKKVWLHVPVLMPVLDIRKVTTRMKDKELFCSIIFPAGEIFAVAVILDAFGKEQHIRFFHGGAKHQHERNVQISKLNYLSSGELMDSKHNQLLLEKIQKINEHYAHCISRQILSYCESYHVKTLVVPNYSKDFRYKKFPMGNTIYEWIGRKIIHYLDYKAFQQGIILTRVNLKNCFNTCSLCGATLLSLKNKKKEYHCPNGHCGNRYLNEARNLAKNFLAYYPTETKLEIKQTEKKN